MASFFYDGEKGERNFTSITGERPNLSFLPFTIDKVAVLDCCNGLILCLCIEAVGSRYVVYNPATKNMRVLPPSINVMGQVRLGFDLIASSHFHVIEFVEEEDTECRCFELPPTSKFLILRIWLGWCAKRTRGLYWFGWNIPASSSLLLLVLLALKSS